MPSPGQSDAAPDGRGFRGLERLGQKAVVMFGGNVLGALLGFVALLAIGRYYHPGAYGAYLFAVSLVGIVHTLFLLGFSQAHSREVARGTPVGAALGVHIRMRLAINGLKVGVVLVAVWVWWGLLDKGITDSTSVEVLLIILAASVLQQIRHIADDTWNGQGRVHRVEWTRFVDSVAYAAVIALIGLGLGAASGRWIPLPGLGAAVADVLALPGDASPLVLARYVALGHFAGKVAGLALAALWWFGDRTPVGGWDPELADRYRRFALPVALSAILLLLLQHTDILMLGFFWTKKEVGWYGAAQKLAGVALIATIAVRGLLMPYFASLFKRGEDDRAMRAFRQVERFLLMGVIPIAIAMMVWAREGLHIFVGDSFLGAASALQWLAAWTLVSALNMPIRAKHMGAGETGIIVGAAAVNVVTNIALNLLLIPVSILGIPLAGLGPEGAAIATFASSLAAYAWNRMAARRLYGIPPIDRAQVRMAAAALAPLGVWLWLRATLPAAASDRVYELAWIGLVGGAAYLAALWLVRGFGRADVALLKQVLDPKGLADEARGRG